MRIRREDKIFLDIKGDNTFEVKDSDNKTLLGANDDYFIYFNNVNFRKNGTIEGRYLGVATDLLIDSYCKDVRFDKGLGFKIDDKIVMTARMVAVDNKRKTVIIIEDN